MSDAVVESEHGEVFVGHSLLRLGRITLRNDLPALRPQTSFPKNFVCVMPEEPGIYIPLQPLALSSDVQVFPVMN